MLTERLAPERVGPVVHELKGQLEHGLTLAPDAPGTDHAIVAARVRPDPGIDDGPLDLVRAETGADRVVRSVIPAVDDAIHTFAHRIAPFAVPAGRRRPTRTWPHLDQRRWDQSGRRGAVEIRAGRAPWLGPEGRGIVLDALAVAGARGL